MAIDVINSLKFGNDTHVFSLPYGTCSTIPTVAAKTVSVDNFSLETGARVTVKFNYGNTKASPTLNVNNTGAKAIKYRQSDIPAEIIEAGRIYEFIYDGTNNNYELIGDIDTNTTYPSAGSSLGLVKTGGDVTITNGLISVNDDSHAHVISNIDGLADTLNSKASLGSDGRVLASQLPSYVDDVIEGTDFGEDGYENEHGEIIISGETGKIYVDTVSNKTYRWSGSKFVEISASLALGTTSSTAYRGDRGNTAYQHSQITSGNPHGTTKSDLGLGNVENKSSATIRGELTKSNVITALGYTPPTSNTNTTYDFAASKSSTNGNVKLNLTAGGSGSGTDSVTVKGTGATSVTTDANGVVTIDSTLPVATSTALGGVKSGTDITVDANGNVSVKDNSHAHTIANISGLQNALNLAYDVIEGTGFENGSDAYFWGDEVRSGGEAGKIYIDADSNKFYRWSSSDSFFIEISASKGHTHSVTHKPEGTIAKTSITPAGSVSSTFTGTAHNHTFTGSAVNSGKPDTTNVTSIYSITGVGTLPSLTFSAGTLPSASHTASSLTSSVTNQCLTLSFTADTHTFSAGTLPSATFSAGSLPTRSSAISMPNTNHTHSVTAAGSVGNKTAGGTVSSTFTGTAAEHTHTFTGTSATLTTGTDS